MIFNHFFGGGKRTAIVSLYGALGEDITLTALDGTALDPVTLNAHGISDTTFEVPVGIYTITGSVSAEILPEGRMVVVDKTTTKITAYPPGAIFWFGNGDTDGDSLYTGNFTHTGGHKPSGASGASGYSQITKGDLTVGASCSCPSSAGSTYGGTTYSPKLSLTGYSYVNIYANCYSTSKAAFGFPESKATSWSTNMYVKPTQTSYQLYSMAVPETQTEGYLAMSAYGCKSSSTYSSATIKAAWMDNIATVPKGEIATSIRSIDVGTETYRYSPQAGADWGASYLYSTEAYFGTSGEGSNITLINLGKFTIPDGATPTRLRLSFYGYRSSQSYFCWAICTSKGNKEMYEGMVGEFDGDDTQIAMGTQSLNSVTSSSYTTMTFDFKTDAIPSGTPLYMYLWSSDQGANGVSHITRYLNAKVYYTYEG